MASRASDLYCITPKQKGEILEVTDKILRVKLEDGTTKGWEIGDVYGPAEGKTIRQRIKTDMSVGDKFDADKVIAWNENWFYRDPLEPDNALMTIGALGRTVLLENRDTHEDGSRIGPRLRDKLRAPGAKRETVILDQTSNIENLVKIGQELEDNDVLCNIIEGSVGNITEAEYVALSRLSGSSPRTDHAGVVTKIEVFYNADLTNLSPSLLKLVKDDNKRRKALRESLGDTSISETGFVKRPTFFNGKKLVPGKVVVDIYLNSEYEFGVGDKQVLANQLKSVPGATIEGRCVDEDGETIDCFFGYRSVNDRIVNSVMDEGYTIGVSMQMTKIYFEILQTGKVPDYCSIK